MFLINLAQRSQGDEFKCLSIYVGVVFYVLHITVVWPFLILLLLYSAILHFCISFFFVWTRLFYGNIFIGYFILTIYIIEINTRTHHHSTNEISFFLYEWAEGNDENRRVSKTRKKNTNRTITAAPTVPNGYQRRQIKKNQIEIQNRKVFC